MYIPTKRHRHSVEREREREIDRATGEKHITHKRVTGVRSALFLPGRMPLKVAATHCNTPQHTAAHYITRVRSVLVLFWTLILAGHFSRKSPRISGSFAERDLQDQLPYVSSDGSQLARRWLAEMAQRRWLAWRCKVYNGAIEARRWLASHVTYEWVMSHMSHVPYE